jgi:hypothetical protein
MPHTTPPSTPPAAGRPLGVPGLIPPASMGVPWAFPQVHGGTNGAFGTGSVVPGLSGQMPIAAPDPTGQGWACAVQPALNHFQGDVFNATDTHHDGANNYSERNLAPLSHRGGEACMAEPRAAY